MAWWEGYDLSSLARKTTDTEGTGADTRPKSTAEPPKAGLNRHGKPLWTATRIEVSEQIWGKGFISPGGDDYVPYLVKPLGLNPAMSVVDLSAGLGGTTRAMAKQFGAWVTGLEGSPLLGQAGMQRSIDAGLGRQAPVELYDPEDFSFKKRVDAVFSKEAFFTIHNKDRLLDGIEACLKSRGQVLFTDYILESQSDFSRALHHWAEREPLEPKLWTLDEVKNALMQRNLDLRIFEDITESHRSMILKSVQGFTEHLEKYHLDKETKVNVVEEVETWALRVGALSAGLKCYRFFALKPALD